MWSKQTVSRIQDASIPSPSSLFSCLSFPFNLPPPRSPSLSGPMLTFWLMEKQQLGLRGTDMRLARRVCEQMFHWKHLEVYMGGKSKLLPAAPFSPVPLFSANWSGSLDSNSLRYENPPVWPAPHAGFPFCLLQVWWTPDKLSMRHPEPVRQRLFIALLQPGSLLLPHV